ncbi:MAG: hypothetical protein ACKOXB_05030 [Flavobacteriales bacterium]
MILSPAEQEFIFSDLDKNYNFIHVTTKPAALGIMSKGFYFEDPLYKTADLVTGNSGWLDFWWQQRKFYGDHIILISISKALFEYCATISKYELDNRVNTFQLLNSSIILHTIDGEAQLTLGQHFIKGYINRKEKTINKNPSFDPTVFKHAEANIKKYKEILLKP